MFYVYDIFKTQNYWCSMISLLSYGSTFDLWHLTLWFIMARQADSCLATSQLECHAERAIKLKRQCGFNNFMTRDREM